MESTQQRPARSFQDLRVWQAAYRLAIEVYNLCRAFPEHERYGLTSQMRRASISVCSNIAEGFGRRTIKEKDQFYGIANGSLTELENQLLIAKGVGYLLEVQFNKTSQKCLVTHRMLTVLQKVNRQKGARS